MQNMIDFYEATDKFGEFSNYHVLAVPLIYNGKSYASSEHLYQSLKFQYEGASPATRAYADVVRLAKTPNMSKILARQQIGGRYAWQVALNKIIEQSKRDGVTKHPEWETVKDAQMEIVLQLKFEQNPKCRNLLLSTGDATLSEHTSRDHYWGDGGESRKGKNILGKLLMKTRTKLQEAKKKREEDEGGETKPKKAKIE